MNHDTGSPLLIDDWDLLDFIPFLSNNGFYLNTKPTIEKKVGNLFHPTNHFVVDKWVVALCTYHSPQQTNNNSFHHLETPPTELDLDITTLPANVHQSILRFQDKNSFIRCKDKKKTYI